jgi:hypothetical protein
MKSLLGYAAEIGGYVRIVDRCTENYIASAVLSFTADISAIASGDGEKYFHKLQALQPCNYKYILLIGFWST